MKALVFDTETDDLVINRTLRLEKQPEIIQFCGIVADLATGEIEQIYTRYIKPKTPVNENGKAFKKSHRITNSRLADALPFAEHAANIRQLFPGVDAAIAHNISFDSDMLDIEFERLGQKIEWPRKICTVEQTIHIKGFRLSLGDMHEMLFGERFEGAHDAEKDTLALLRCCVELYRRDLL